MWFILLAPIWVLIVIIVAVAYSCSNAIKKVWNKAFGKEDVSTMDKLKNIKF